jgi:protein-tyrosine phosphatase
VPGTSAIHRIAVRLRSPAGTADKVQLFLGYATGRSQNVPDPYYEGAEAFEALYQMLDAGCSSLLERLGERTS